MSYAVPSAPLSSSPSPPPPSSNAPKSSSKPTLEKPPALKKKVAKPQMTVKEKKARGVRLLVVIDLMIRYDLMRSMMIMLGVD